MTVRIARHDDIEIAYETFGRPSDEPLLLITGIGGQMLGWREGFCHRLAARGFHVVRFDNRDAGLSTRFSAAGAPSRFAMYFRPASAAVYRLEDMADDAVAVIDALGESSAHIVGISQGGMIGQVLAVRNPERVRTLTSISSTPAPRLGQPRPRTLLKLLRVANPKRVRDREDMAAYTAGLQEITGSPGYPADKTDIEELRALGRQCFDRGGYDLASVQRQTAAIAASGDRRAELARVSAPTLVLHGEEDEVVRLVGGRATAEAIPGARLVAFPGMGHDLPRALWPAIIDEIAGLAESARAGGSGPAGAGRDAAPA